ncbi:MAG: hypothetical protein ACJ07L_05390 [Opitutales bacterium]
MGLEYIGGWRGLRPRISSCDGQARRYSPEAEVFENKKGTIEIATFENLKLAEFLPFLARGGSLFIVDSQGAWWFSKKSGNTQG